MTSIALTPAALAGYDCVLIATHHAAYDWQMIGDNASLIVDRNLEAGREDKVAIYSDDEVSYGELARRGETLVSGVRRSRPTRQAAEATRTAVSRTKAANTRVRRSTRTTRSSVKAAGTSARKAAAADTKAAKAAAAKVGEK